MMEQHESRNTGGFSFEKLELLEHLLKEEEGIERTQEAIRPQQRPEKIPLSVAQQQLWFLEHLKPGTATYTLPAAYRIRGRLNIPLFQHSIHEIIRRHEALRTNFVSEGEQPFQVIATALDLPCSVVDLCGLPEARREIEALRLATQQMQWPFDLIGEALVRVILLRLTEEEHLFLLTMHHIISDGWSLRIFFQELAALYQAFSYGYPSPLTELPLQYPDYILWQQEWLQGEVLASQLSYWKQHLADIPTMLNLPTDYPRPSIQTFQGAMPSFTLPSRISEKLKAFSRREEVTLFMTLLAAFYVLLYRYTGQADIVVGSPVANRDRDEFEELIGFFVNTVALRAHLSDDFTFRAVLHQVREVILGAHAHQALPFEKLVEALQPERALSHNPLFQVMFAFQTGLEPDMTLGDLSLSHYEIDTGTAKFDMSLFLVETPRGLEGALEYNTDLFEASTITRILEHFQIILESIVEHPEQCLFEIPLLNEAEKYQLLVGWNNTRITYPQEPCLHGLFEAQVELTPNQRAVIFEEQFLTYRDLNRKANQLAHSLQSLGVGPEVLVGICMERSLEMVVGLLGILKAGGAYVPLDPGYPHKRLQLMLDDAHVPVLLTQDSLVFRLPAHEAHMICLDTNWEDIGRQCEANPDRRAGAENVAYVIYTSGSTGVPKGVMNSHQGICNRLLWMQQMFELTGQDRVLQKTPFSFDVSLWEFFWPLITGATLVMAKPDGHKDSTYLCQFIKAQKITTLHFVPSMLHAFLQEHEVEGCESLKRVFCSGEALPFELQERFFARLGATLHNLYGPTEAAIDVTSWECQRESERRTVPIGRPIANIQIYLLDAHLQPVPLGVVGELYIGGTGLARGYLNRPTLTAETFIPNPFTSLPGTRLYKTGDLARYLPDGTIEFLGRVDHQAKIRGFRIELGEIEAALSQHAAIQDVVASVREDIPTDKYLVAYLVPRQGQSPKVDDLRSYLKEKLPEYMVPRAFVLLNTLPLAPNGKIDRKALPKPGITRPELASPFSAPSTPTEMVLADIWRQVLGINQVGIHDNFFALGGDSLRSLQILTRAKQRGLHYSLQQLFQHQTIHEQAQVIQLVEANAGPALQTTPLSLISQEDRLQLPPDVEDAYPLTTLQAGMLYHMELMPEAPVYQNLLSFHIQAKFDAGAMQEAVQRVVTRHAVLRTTFDLTTYSQPLQLVHRMTFVPVQVEDLRHLSFEEQEEAITAFIRNEERHFLDLSRLPLQRVSLHCRTDKTFQFSLSESHALQDGWSAFSTMSEIFENYFAILHNTPLNPPLLTGSFRDFVLLERLALESEECQHYWTQKLKHFTATEVPRWPSFPRPARTVRIYQLDLPLSAEVTEGLKRLALSASVPLKSVLLAAHLKVMGIISGRVDVSTGVSFDCRPEEANSEQLRGLFLSVLPFRLHLTEGTWLDLVRRTFETETELLPFRRYPLVQLQKDLRQRTLFETAFTYVHFYSFDRLAQSDDFICLATRRSEETNFVISTGFALSPFSSQLFLLLDYDTTQLSDQQMETITACYQQVLNAMAAEPTAYHASRSFLPPEEQHQLLVERNVSERAYPENLCVHELFEAQAQRTPQKVAAEFEGEQLTYRELNARANQLARYLQQLGVGPEVRVGLYVEPSLDMVVSVLGVLKSGGAYVPLDSHSPQKRLAFIIEDARLSVLLTQERLLSGLSRHSARIVCLDREWKNIGEEHQGNLKKRTEPANLAYIIFTSGSTGTPKGVMATHQGVVNYLHWCIEAYAEASGSGSLVHSPLSFDLTVTSLFTPLLVGQQVTLLPEEEGNETLSTALRGRENLSLIKLTPAHLDLLGQTLAGVDMAHRVSVVIVGGEAFSAKSLSLWLQRAPQTRFINEYGPTETVVGCCVYDASSYGESNGTVPIGSPIANTQLYILDQQMQPVPIGVPGQLYVGGAGVARGYLNQPGLTAERFVPHPFSQQQGARLYCTGDVARYLPDGNMEFLGRSDTQVKVRGFRIELGEIESLLAKHPMVQDTTVMVQEDPSGYKRLIAYVVPSSKQTLVTSQLRNFLQERLPDYMLPAAFVILDSFPLTPNGKVDRHALPAPDESRPALQMRYMAPRTPLEEKLAAIWGQVLRRERVGVYDNFFELGGDSILSIQILARAHRAGIHLTPKQMFQRQTIAQLASVVDTVPQFESTQGLVTGPVPLTPIQHWFFERDLPDPAHFNQSLLLEGPADLNPHLLEQATGYLLQHHDALRLRFVRTAWGWQQTIVSMIEQGPIPLSQIDLSTSPADEQQQALVEMANHLQASLNLEAGPLLRLIYFYLGEGQPCRLLWIIHHLAVDSVSWRILLEDLHILYQQGSQGQDFSLSPKTTSFQYWARRLQQHAHSEVLLAEMDKWLGSARYHVRPLPIDFPDGQQADANTEASARTVSISLSQEETQALLHEVPRAYHTQIGDVLLTCLLQTFLGWTGEQMLLVDLEGHGREALFEEVDLSRTVGWFTSVFPVLLRLEGKQEVGQVLQAVKEQLRLIPQHGIGYGMLRYLNDGRTCSAQLRALPQAQVSFNYLGQFGQIQQEKVVFQPARQFGGIENSPRGIRSHLLEVTAEVVEGSFCSDWIYSERLHARTTIEQLANTYRESLRALIAHCLSCEGDELVSSDFPEARLSQSELDSFIATITKLEKGDADANKEH